MEAITQRKLTSMARRWQKKLRLMDWKIKVRLLSKDEMIAKEVENEQDPETCIGMCEPLAEQRIATISILRPEDIGNVHEGVNLGLEATVVHELLHCHFASFTNNETRLAVEQAVEAITEALVANE